MKKLVCMMTIVALLTAFHVHSVEAFDGAEVFDIQKGEVVATIKNSASLQSEVAKWLSCISGPVESLHIEPDRGLGVKIQLTPPLKVEMEDIKGTVMEVVLFLSPEETYYPTLLMITKENGTFAVHLTCNLRGFLKANHLYKPELNLKIPSVAER
ncbi:hypothetical protein [Paenibacillus alba]|uniref:Uncharacterized protein n=1 Tax=Paenibacillus alba TaxID=1197127 RepID=A0ABU6G9R6_9BACL|nr:hypothetical protein [Paenibacillus alba]MEC0229479.1 hypothetical protein [Paenibacillus alba]